jgi:hypothetical protein
MFNVPPSSLRLDTRCSLSTRRPGFLAMSLPQCRSPVAITANEVVQQPPLSIGMVGFTVIEAFLPIDLRIGFVNAEPVGILHIQRTSSAVGELPRRRPPELAARLGSRPLKPPSVGSILKM